MTRPLSVPVRLPDPSTSCPAQPVAVNDEHRRMGTHTADDLTTHRAPARPACRAVFIAAMASRQGKTTVTAALARHYRRRGLRVRCFKTGPDYLDPMILSQASGQPVYQLDLWMGGEADCRRLLADAARDCDIILIEGVMGLYDGQVSSADLACLFGIPVLLVIDGSAMAQTFAAIAEGLAGHRPGLPLAGVVANRVAGRHHHAMLVEALPDGIPSRGWLPRDAGIGLPERHLGLFQATEIADLDARIDRAAEALDGIADWLPDPVEFPAADASRPPATLLAGRRIAIARDASAAFVYPANLDLLRALGAELTFVSLLDDDGLAGADALYLPGGYPELHLDRLAGNTTMRAAIQAHHAAGRPIVAECGGMLYLGETITDRDGHTCEMLGLLPARARLGDRLVNLGQQRVTLPEGELRGHTFHYSRLDCPLEPVAWSEPARAGRPGEAVYRQGRLQASYLHLYFPSNPRATAALFAPAPDSDPAPAHSQQEAIS